MEDKNNYSYPDISNTSTKIYFCDRSMNETHFHPYHSPSPYIRLCIFLITSVCVGLPALVWAFRLLYLHGQIREQISPFMLILIFSDLIQLPLSLYVVTQLLMILNWTPELFKFWTVLHWCGFHLHQLVALEGVLTLNDAVCSASIFSYPCYFIIFILVLAFSVQSAFIFLMDPFVNTNMLLFNIATSLTYLSLLAVTFSINYKASSTYVSKNICSVFTVAIFTFVMLFLPFLLFICVTFFTGRVHISWYEMSVCLMSLRVISDPLLCVLICREYFREVQTPQTHTEPNADEISLSSVLRELLLF